MKEDLKSKIGLVLSGGGARGAYEIGVLRYVRERLGMPTRFDIITGTSVGAINGAYIAATVERPKAQSRFLARVWSDLTVDEVYRFGWSQIRKLPNFLFGKQLPEIMEGDHAGGLVDWGHLRETVEEKLPWSNISTNLAAGHLDAFACTATELATGLSTTFLDRGPAAKGKIWNSSARHEVTVETKINASHALASAAIPGLFPAVNVGGHLFVDGMLHQNTPLRPALRLGANRLLVVSLDHPDSAEELRLKRRAEAKVAFPNAFFLLGKTFNALMLDRLHADLQQVDRVNAMLRAGVACYGEAFPEKISQKLGRDRPIREVKSVVIRPSVNLSEIAWEVVRRTGLKRHSGLAARMIRRSMEEVNRYEPGSNDFASYTLFDREYISALIDLGFRDAQKAHVELQALFAPG